MTFSRRKFLQFMGRTSIVAPTAYLLSQKIEAKQKEFKHLPVSFEDRLNLSEGFESQIFIRAGDKINSKEDEFGYNNDFIATIPIPNKPNEALLWVNHEYPIPLFVSGYKRDSEKTKAQVIQEQKSVGGSILKIKQKADGFWEWVKNDPFNRRIDGRTLIPIVSERAIAGKSKAIGTLANCSGGKTPWNTILTCEENYEDYYGSAPTRFQWNRYFNYPVEHYGWVVEVNLFTGKAKKLTGLGRFSHECAICVVAPDGRTVVYSGDDDYDQFLYKFISEKPGSLDKGELFVADIKNGKWISLNRNNHPELKKRYRDQTDLLIHTKEAAAMVGATPLNRPEDIDHDPVSKDIIVALTGNAKKGDPFGSLLRLEEKDKNPLSLEFNAKTLAVGGKKLGFVCPDNLAFDSKGNLLITSDIGPSVLHSKEFKSFGNNSLFHIALQGKNSGKFTRIANAPNEAEFTGPCFSLDEKVLFLSVQHPGEKTTDLSDPTSRWPDGGNSLPCPAVVQIKFPSVKT